MAAVDEPKAFPGHLLELCRGLDENGHKNIYNIAIQLWRYSIGSDRLKSRQKQSTEFHQNGLYFQRLPETRKELRF